MFRSCPSLAGRLPRLLTSGLLPATLCLSLLPDPAAACGGTSPPLFCGKTLVLSKAVPGVVLLPPGVMTVNIPTLVFFNLLGNACPTASTVTVNLTATCTGGIGVGSVTAALSIGFNPIVVPVNVGGIPTPSFCAISGTATTTLSDSMMLTAAGDSVMCLADPAPGNPSLPRLDMQVLGPAGSEIVRVHPGDQASFTYRITNNDPSASFWGLLNVEMVSSSRMPTAGGPTSPGSGPYAVSAPVEGDNFPIAFPDDLIQGCVSLPPDPPDPVIPSLEEEIHLGPGESIDVDVFARPWGMCANGSCGEATLVLDGNFSDLSEGRACAGLVTAADTSVPPTYLWPDAGMVGVPWVDPFLPPVVGFNVVATPSSPETSIEISTDTALLFAASAILAPQLVISEAVDSERGRTRLTFRDPTGLDPDIPIDVTLNFGIQPSPGQTIETELIQMDLISGAPSGFENVNPAGDALLEIRQSGSPEVDSFLSILYQVLAVGIDELGTHRDIRFGGIEFSPRPDGGGFDVNLAAGIVEPGPGSLIQSIEIIQDFRAFGSEEPPGQDPIFFNGFESGDVSAWTTVKP